MILKFTEVYKMNDEYIFDTQALIEGSTLNEDDLTEQIETKFPGNSLIVGGDDELMKVHYHTDNPGRVIDYLITIGTVFDVVIENMERQAKGLKG